MLRKKVNPGTLELTFLSFSSMFPFLYSIVKEILTFQVVDILIIKLTIFINIENYLLRHIERFKDIGSFRVNISNIFHTSLLVSEFFRYMSYNYTYVLFGC